MPAGWKAFFGRHGGAILYWVAGLLPGLVALHFAREHAVDVPLWDDWERGPLLRKWYAGELTFGDLYGAHIQHRMVFPRLLTLLFNAWSGGDLRWEMWAGFGCIAAAAAGTLYLLRACYPAVSPAVGLLVGAILFSPMQHQNYLWVTTQALVMPGACLVGALLALRAGWPLAARWGAAAALAIIGSHSFGHGMVLWACLLPPLLFCGATAGVKARAMAGAAWLLLAGTLAFFYYRDLENIAHPAHAYQLDGEKPAGPTGLAALVADPAAGAVFFLRLLGSPLCRGLGWELVDSAFWIGLGLLLVFAGVAGWSLLGWRDAKARDRDVPWLVLGGFALLCAAAISLGRVGLIGESRALVSRYISMTQFLPVAIVGLVLARADGRIAPPAIAWAGWVVTGFALCWIGRVWIEGAALSEIWSHGRLRGKAQLVLLRIARPTNLHVLDGDAKFLKEQAEFLDGRGLLRPPMAKERWLDQFPESKSPASSKNAGIDPLARDGDAMLVRGHARLSGGRPADAVLLCRRQNGDRWEIRALADPVLPAARPAFFHDYEFGGYDRMAKRDFAGWKARLPAAEMTAPGIEWSVWLLDAKKWRVQRVPGDPAAARPSP